MGIMQDASRLRARLFRDRKTVRSSAAVRRGMRVLRPMAEDLEGRTLLSVGLDPTWGMGGESSLIVPQNSPSVNFSASINTLALQNGQVVEAGTLTSTAIPSGTSTTNIIVSRLTTSGTLDTTFGSGGTELLRLSFGSTTYTLDQDTPVYVAVQSNGSIDVLATATPTGSSNSDLLVAQLTPSGSIDTSFGTLGFQLISFGPSATPDTNTSATALAIGPNGKLDALANTTLSTGATLGDTVFAIAQLNTNGTLDTTFNGTGTTTVDFQLAPAGTEDDIANGLVVQPNGSIVAVGEAFLAPSSPTATPLADAVVARLTSGGALDTSFNGTGELSYSYNLGGTSQDSANSVTLEGTQIVIAGSTSQISTTTPTSTAPLPADLTVTRLNTNGSFDTSFNGSGKLLLSLTQGGILFNTSATAITTLADNSLLVLGSASPFNSSTSASGGLLMHVLSTGALDTNYGSNGVALLPASPNATTEVVVQTDGKALFLTGSSQVARTTAPVPAVVTTTINTTGTGKKAKATGVTLTFNTAINPTLASNIASYLVRPMKGNKAIKLKKKGGIVYNPTTQTLTLNFASKTAVGKGFRVVITPGGIVAADGQILFNGAAIPILIAPTT